METEDEFYSRYQPDSSSLQFVFRGAIIFRGAIQDLRMKHRLDEAEEILLVGSSAGNLCSTAMKANGKESEVAN